MHIQVCLNKMTGETIWVNNEIPGTCGYNSLIIKDLLGFRQVIGASSNCFMVLTQKQESFSGRLIMRTSIA